MWEKIEEISRPTLNNFPLFYKEFTKSKNLPENIEREEKKKKIYIYIYIFKKKKKKKSISIIQVLSLIILCWAPMPV